ncbi:MAG: hypothetical protein HY816_20225 [Candidatus Wallbacteria bacterium]|nr:hypothetical protein [Candidatus Wallbacteria bacterium]
MSRRPVELVDLQLTVDRHLALGYRATLYQTTARRRRLRLTRRGEPSRVLSCVLTAAGWQVEYPLPSREEIVAALGSGHPMLNAPRLATFPPSDSLKSA